MDSTVALEAHHSASQSSSTDTAVADTLGIVLFIADSNRQMAIGGMADCGLFIPISGAGSPGTYLERASMGVERNY